MNGFGDWLGSWFGGGGGNIPSDITAGIEAGVAPAAAAAPTWSFGDVARGIWDSVSKGLTGLGRVAQTVLPIAQLGTGVMGAITSAKAGREAGEQAKMSRQSQQLQQEMTRQAAGAAQPVTQFGAEQLALAQAGKLPAPIEQQIELWKAGAKQKARDYLARIGQGDSKALLDWESWIDQQGVAMAGQALRDMQQLGVTSLTGAAGALTGAAGQAASGADIGARQMASLEALISQANEQLGALAGGQQ